MGRRPDPCRVHDAGVLVRWIATREVCTERHRLRSDDSCARDAEGAVVPGGCPVGAEAVRRLAEYVENARAAEHAARRTRRVAA